MKMRNRGLLLCRVMSYLVAGRWIYPSMLGRNFPSALLMFRSSIQGWQMVVFVGEAVAAAANLNL